MHWLSALILCILLNVLEHTRFYMTDIAYLSRSLSHTQKYNMGKKCMKVGMC